MINDRGTKKWTSLMLPEHVKMLEDMYKEMDHKEKPVLDEQQMEENYFMLQEALENESKVSIKYYANYDHVIEEGYLLNFDGINKVVNMEEININFDDIIEVSLM